MISLRSNGAEDTIPVAQTLTTVFCVETSKASTEVAQKALTNTQGKSSLNKRMRLGNG